MQTKETAGASIEQLAHHISTLPLTSSAPFGLPGQLYQDDYKCQVITQWIDLNACMVPLTQALKLL
jgi:hypothetical protein